MSKSEKITQFVIVICIAAIITAVGNVMDGKHLFGDSLIGVAVLAGLATIGAMISYLPYANKIANGILGVSSWRSCILTWYAWSRMDHR